MGVWDIYHSRVYADGNTKRDIKINREKRYISNKLPSNLSYKTVTMNGEDCNLAVINTDILTQKKLCSMPGEKIVSGSLINWSDAHWLVTSVDPDNEIYAKAVMVQCNHLLRWIAKDGSIVERWCIVSDGTKYLTGETISSYNENGMSLGDTRISVSLARDEYSSQLDRSQRFLIDDAASTSVLAYRLTKPFKVGGVFDGSGVMSFVMSEVNTEFDDNLDLRIADYYKYFPREDATGGTGGSESAPDAPGKKVWL